MVKFSNDTALLSLLNDTESVHGYALTKFIEWCDDSFLDLNVSKTKEIIIDFRKSTSAHEVSLIHNKGVEIVDNYKYLGTVFDSKLKFDANSVTIIKRAQQRVHLLRKLSSFNVCNTMLQIFYSSFIETFSFICWYNGLTVRDRNSLNNVVRVCSKIIGVQQKTLRTIWEERVVQKARGIILQPNHILHSEFILLSSGRRFKAPLTKTNRYSMSFIPSAIRLLNA